MKYCLSALAIAVAVCLAAPMQAAETYKVSSEKSKIDFVGKKTDGQHKGGFKKVSGDAKVEPEKPEHGSIKLVIDAASIWADDNKLTEHLKNPDFFNVRKYPKITFESTKVEMTGEHTAMILGKLTMLDKTVETKVPVTAEATDEGIKLKAVFKIDRTKWGMNYGEGKILNDVDVVADLLLTK
jgi:polyisoprenoid-binding protein YceI